MKSENTDLSKEQAETLYNKATEPPFSGEYLDNKKTGMYNCAGCSAELFSSDTKFDSGSGWPSFDQALPGAVKELTDYSHGMVRTEAVCANCGGHLGHVFNDGPKDTAGMRYCVNSLSLNFNEQKKTKS